MDERKQVTFAERQVLLAKIEEIYKLLLGTNAVIFLVFEVPHDGVEDGTSPNALTLKYGKAKDICAILDSAFQEDSGLALGCLMTRLNKLSGPETINKQPI